MGTWTPGPGPTSGNDTFVGDGTNETANGGAGNDTLSGDAGDDNLYGGAGQDILNGGDGNDSLVGGADLMLLGDGEADTLIGGAGNDDYYWVDASDTVIEQAGEGTDRIHYGVYVGHSAFSLETYANVEQLELEETGDHIGGVGTGNALNNTIYGTGGLDTLYGLDGNDTLYGRGSMGGTDTFVGGAGDDIFHIANGDTVTELAGEGEDTVWVSGSFSLAGVANVENLTLIASPSTGAQTGTGNELNNRIFVYDLPGPIANDTLDGGAGDDYLSGSFGNDTYIIDSLGDVVVEGAINGASDTIRTTLNAYSLSSANAGYVENLTFIGSGNFAGTGSALNNIITGGAGDDTLDGGDGDDALDGGAGADTMTGGAGNDTYIVDNAGDVVTEQSGEGTDLVQTTLLSYLLGDNVENLAFTGAGNFSGVGNALANAITGGAGNDTLDGGAGADTLIGGGGNDTYVIDNAADVITEGASAGTDVVQTTLSSFTLGANLENLTFVGAGDFSGVGNALANVITGGDGNDTLNGGAGADTLSGGLGDDIYIVDNAGDQVIEPYYGRDTVQTTLGSYTLTEYIANLTYTGTGNFTGSGNTRSNIITGGAGNDTLYGGDAGADQLYGGAGNDTYIINHTQVSVTDTSGVDTIVTTLSSYSFDFYDNTNIENLTFAGIGGFVGFGNALANIIIGGAGNDILSGEGGADTLIGGAGDDIYILESVSVVSEAAGEGIDLVDTNQASYTLGANLENLSFSGPGNFVGTGNALANVITGGAGNDTIDGGAGNDTLIGGDGDDVYIVDSVGDIVTEQSYNGTDTVRTTLNTYTLGNTLENLIFTGVGDFTGTGGAALNVITGGAGNDRLDGGLNDDTLVGGAGNDTYIVDSAGDIVTETSGQGTDLVQTTLAAYTLGSNVENLTFTGAGNFFGTGNALANVITGGAGADTLNGGAGADTLIGGAGNDTYVVDNAGDIVTESSGEGTDLVQTTLAAYTLGSNHENLTFAGAGNFSGTGNTLANVITGGAGADTLNGGTGADTLIGGDGNDTYVVDSAGDVVTETSGQGTDLVQATSASYTLGANTENLTFIGAGAFAGTGNAAANTITGGASGDTLDGGGGADTLIGGGGNDIYVVDNSGDVVTESSGEGTDLVQTTLAAYTLGSNVENLTFTGAGNFAGAGNTLANVITGGAGADTLNGGTGADTLIGGDGNDTYVVDNVGDAVAEIAGQGTDLVQTTLSTYVLGANLENLTFTGAGNFSAAGNELANTIIAGAGSDSIGGGDGNDTLDGGAGVDSLVGGAGDDTYYVSDSGEQITENVGAGNDSVIANASYILAANVESLTFQFAQSGLTGSGNALNNVMIGGAFNDWLNGLDGNDTLSSGAGNDNLFGGAGTDILLGQQGDDYLDGGAGADQMTGGAGDDTYTVDDAGDVVTEQSGEGADTVRTELASLALASNLENLTFTGSGTFSGIGNALANTLTGFLGNDTLTGGGGNDMLIGGLGTDTATYSGARSNYTVTTLGNGDIQVVDSRGGSPDGNDTLSGIEFLQFSDQTVAALMVDTIAGNTSTTSTITVGGASQTSLIDTLGDQDWFRVTLTAGQTYTFSLNGSGGSSLGDPYLGLRNSGGTLLAVDDDSGPGLNSLLQYTASTTGTYYLDVQGFNGGYTGQYTLTAATSAPAIPDAVAGSTATTASITVGGPGGTSLINSFGDHDWFRVTLTAGQSYAFSVTATGANPLSDPFLAVRNASGALVSIDDDGGTGYDSLMHFTATASGTYYLDVGGSSNTETGEYTVTAVTGPPQDPLDTLDLGFTINHTNISVYFATSGQNFGAETASRSWTASEISAAMSAFATFSAVTPLTFTQVGSSAGADFIMSIAPLGGALGLAYTNGGTQALVEFDPAGYGWSSIGASSMQGGGYGYITLVHEIGHALGLDHPHLDGEDNQVMQGVLSPFNSYGTYELNQGVFTTMGYNDGWDLGPLGTSATPNYGWQSGPMALDIAALQASYGVNATANNGNNVYGLTTTNQAGTGFRTIWDTGGTDAISYSGSANAVIDLRAATLQSAIGGGGYVSYVNGVIGGFTIAAGVLVENAYGGIGNDTITGNDAANNLQGSDGNDTLDGGVGNDLLQGGNQNDLLIGGIGDDTLQGDAGNDTLRGGVGLNTLDGGTGANSADYTWTTLGIFADIAAVSNQVTSVGGGAEAFTDQLTNVQTVIGGSGADTSIFRNIPFGVVQGFDGRGGVDVADFRNFGSSLWIDLGASGVEGWTTGTASQTSGAWRAIADLANVENFITTAYDDYIRASGADNALIYVGGYDQFDGGANASGYGDVVDFSGFGSALLVDLGAGAGQEAWTRDGSNVLSGTWRAIADISNIERVIGTNFDDQLVATSGTVSLMGGAGADTLFIRSASNPVLLDGGAGGDDTADFRYFGAAVWITLSYADYDVWTMDATNLTSGTWRSIGELASVETVVGSAYDDFLRGDANDNRFGYTNGYDVVNGQGGVDTLDYSRFSAAVWIDLNYTSQSAWTTDTLTQAGAWRAIGDISAVENIVGTVGADDLRGNSDANTLTGGVGADILLGRGGSDLLDGGDGADTASYAGSSAGVTVNLNAGTATGGDAAGDTLASIENLTGSSNVDTLTGTNGNNILDGGAGADTLIGLGGDDIYIVDNAADVVTENIGEGSDTVRSGMAAGYTIGNNIENYGRTNTASYSVTGNAQDNVFFVTALAAGATATIAGGAHSGVGDTADFTNFGAAVWVDLAYITNIYEAWTTDATSLAAGTYRTIGDLTGIENLVGSRFDDYLAGNAGDNRFSYSGGYDQVNGAGGVDTLFYNLFGSAIWVDLSYSSQTVWTMDRPDLVSGAWRALGDISNVENIVGTSGADFFRGNAAGNLFDGQGGNDTVNYSNSTGSVTVNLGLGQGFGAFADNDQLLSIENVTGSSYVDALYGDGGANVLDGGASADTMAGGAGNDLYYIDNAGDVVSENSGEGIDTIRSSVAGAYTLAAEVENYGRTGSAGYNITGNALDNTFYAGPIGSGQTATISGAGGSDTADFTGFGAAVWITLGYADYDVWTQDTTNLTSGTWRGIGELSSIETVVGSAYDDFLRGDANDNRFVYTNGYDVVNGQGGTDTLDFSRFGSAVWVDLSATSQTAWTTDTLTQAGAYRAIGDVTNVENVVGTLGADLIRGDNNANVIEGGAGNDQLTGRGGADTFLYQGVGGILATGLDVIMDFVDAVDLIHIQSGLAPLAAQAALSIDNSGANSIVTFANSPSFQLTVLNVDLDQSDFLFT